MKNFKKVLALVLVMAIVFGFVVMSQAAFSDEAEITRKEAVDVMAAIGVINGYTDGSFKPKGEVKRSEMAKMITVLLNKGDDVGDLYKGACTFADSASHWAAGYIAYCTQEKIINGRNASKFDPEANVTGTEAAKMLLCALGYDPAVEGLTGSSWASNTLSLARKCEQRARAAAKKAGFDETKVNQKFSLLDNMDDVSMTAPLSRENAAQMILNAMLCTKVDYDGSNSSLNLGNGQSISLGGATLTSDTTKIYNDYEDLAGAKKLKKTESQPDGYGRTARVWSHGGEDFGTYASAPTLTYKDAITGGTLFTDLGKPKIMMTAPDNDQKANGYYKLTVWVDGEVKAESPVEKTSTPVTYKPWTEVLAVGNYDEITYVGSWTEVYVDDDKAEINVFIVRYYAAKIATVSPATKDAAGDVTREAYVTVKQANGNPFQGTTAITESEIFKDGKKYPGSFITDAFTTTDRDSYVVITLGGASGAKKIMSLAKAETKTGAAGSKVMTANGSLVSFELDSTSYKIANTANDFTVKYGAQQEAVLDPNGNIVYANDTGYDAVALSLGAIAGTASLDGSSDTARLLFTDGTVKDVKISNDGDYKLNQLRDQVKVVGYTVNTDGTYKLVNADNVYAATKVTTNSPDLGSTAIANANTTFIFESRTGSVTNSGGTVKDDVVKSYTTYTGLGSIPTTDGQLDADQLRNTTNPYFPNVGDYQEHPAIFAVGTSNDPTTAAYVFVVGYKIKATSTAAVAVFMRNSSADSRTTDANDKVVYTTKAVIGGEIKSVKLTDDTRAYPSLTNKTLVAKDTLEINENGYYSGLGASADVLPSAGNVNTTFVKTFTGFHEDDNGYVDGLYSNGIIRMKDNKAYSVNANTPVFMFDITNNTVTQTTIDAYAPANKATQVLIVLDSAEWRANHDTELVNAIYVVLDNV